MKIGYEQNAYAPNMIDFGPKQVNINNFNLNQLYMKGKHKLHILYKYQLNFYLTVDSAVK